MKAHFALPQPSATICFSAIFNPRDADDLPRLVSSLPPNVTVTLDFSHVKWVKPSALAALVPAIAALRGRHVTVHGVANELVSVAAMISHDS